MVEVTDKRVHARAFDKAAAAFRNQGTLPSAKDMALVAVDRDRIKEVIDVSSVEHSLGDSKLRVKEGVLDVFRLKYAGDKPFEMNYVSKKGRGKVTVSKGTTLATLHARVTNHFPNELIDHLVEMHDSGATQKEMYEFMEGFYERRGGSIPQWKSVSNHAQTREGFPDNNVFFGIC